MREYSLTRRNLLGSTALGTGLAVAGSFVANTTLAAEPASTAIVKNNRLKQSACAWCYPKIPLPQLATAAKAMGLVGLDLISPEDFPVLKEYGLVSTMTFTKPLDKGLCDPQYHEKNIEVLTAAIEATAAEGWKNVICFSGNARGIDRKEGQKNCMKALEKLLPLAESKKVVLSMELLNSRVNHKDYMCDKSEWGIELCKMAKSENFKLLYDIYHMQIMEGDIIRSIKDNHQYFSHYHTGGNPGRNEIDQSQELNYAPICQAIIETGFTGYLAHEFIPKKEPLVSLAEAVALCDV
jgi:hydroxypyruvate isomerase